MSPPPPRPASALGGLRALGLWLAFSLAALAVHAPSLDGGWILDDGVTIVHDPFIQDLSLDDLREIWDPSGAALVHSMNYAPLHLMVHAAELAVFGPSPRAFRIVNLLLHAVTACLLVLLLARSGIPLPGAVAGGAFFLVHPANAEAVSAAFQLKTVLSTALGLWALLAVWKHPAAATLAFGAALLVKFSAAFALPTALVWAYTRSRDEPTPHWAWWVLWGALLVAVAIPEFGAFERVGQNAVALGDDALTRVRSIVAIGARYLAMAVVPVGVSAFHQPAPSGWSDPWWWLGLVSLGGLAWRWVWTLRRRSEEAGYWMLAVAAFAPVSQVFPFLYPMADRYLYAVLPGLIGAGLLAGGALLGPRLAGPGRAAGRWRTGLAALLGVVLAGFAIGTHQRSPVFTSDAAMQREAARNYPDGIHARLLSAHAAGLRRDPEEIARHLRRLADLGFVNWTIFLGDPALQPFLKHPAVREQIDGMAARWIERLGAIAEPEQIELNMLAQAYLVRDELAPGIATLERAIAHGGPYTDSLEETLRHARRDARIRGIAPRRQPRAPGRPSGFQGRVPIRGEP